jgi:hypothetical protein
MGLYLHPPLFSAIFNYLRRAILRTFRGAFSKIRTVISFVPGAFCPDITGTLAHIHITQNRVTWLQGKVCNGLPYNDSVRLIHDMNASYAGHVLAFLKKTNSFAASSPAGI